jgi:hypothetical protein
MIKLRHLLSLAVAIDGTAQAKQRAVLHCQHVALDDIDRNTAILHWLHRDARTRGTKWAWPWPSSQSPYQYNDDNWLPIDDDDEVAVDGWLFEPVDDDDGDGANDGKWSTPCRVSKSRGWWTSNDGTRVASDAALSANDKKWWGKWPTGDGFGNGGKLGATGDRYDINCSNVNGVCSVIFLYKLTTQTANHSNGV